MRPRNPACRSRNRPGFRRWRWTFWSRWLGGTRFRRMARKSSAVLPLRARSDLLHRDPHGPPGRAIGPEADKPFAMGVIERPERLSVRFGQREGVHGPAGEEPEAALGDIRGKPGKRPEAPEHEHEPVRVSLVGLLRDDGKEVQVGGPDRKPGLLSGLPHRALEGRFAARHL